MQIWKRGVEAALPVDMGVRGGWGGLVRPCSGGYPEA